MLCEAAVRADTIGLHGVLNNHLSVRGRLRVGDSAIVLGQ